MCIIHTYTCWYINTTRTYPHITICIGITLQFILRQFFFKLYFVVSVCDNVNVICVIYLYIENSYHNTPIF